MKEIIKYPKKVYGYYRNKWGVEWSEGITIETGYNGGIQFIPFTPTGKESVYFVEIPKEAISELITILQTI